MRRPGLADAPVSREVRLGWHDRTAGCCLAPGHRHAERGRFRGDRMRPEELLALTSFPSSRVVGGPSGVQRWRYQYRAALHGVPGLWITP
jgi:hypothetical protein